MSIKRGKFIKRDLFYITIAFVLILLAVFIFSFSRQIFFQPEATISESFNFNEPQVVFEGDFFSIVNQDLDSVEIPGEPVIPFKTIRFVIPIDQKFDSLEVIPGELIKLSGKYKIRSGQEDYPFLELSNNVDPRSTFIDGARFNELGNPKEDYERNFTLPNATIYGSSSLFPGVTYSIESSQEKYGYTILIIRLYPFQYTPILEELSYYPSINVNVYTSAASMVSSSGEKILNKNFRNSRKDFDKIQDIVDNPESIFFDDSKVSSATEDQYDYILITSRSLESEFQKLINWKISRGVSAGIFFVEDIVINPDYSCSGSFGDGCGSPGENNLDDTQAKIRNFIKHAYMDFGTDYVLLGGDISVIPQRGVYIWTGGWFTNFSVPSDLYYSGLNGSWNEDRDEVFGEPQQRSGPDGCAPILWRNGSRGNEFDLLAEVYVGRAPVETIGETRNFVSKTIKYENDTINNAAYLKKAIIMAERLDKVTDSSESMESLSKNISQFDREKIYEVYWEDIKHPNSTQVGGTTNEVGLLLEPLSKSINTGVSLIAHQGHAGSFTVMRFNPQEVFGWNDTTSFPLNNTIYPFIYSTGCDSAAFDHDVFVWNRSLRGNMKVDSIGEDFVISPYGAFAYIGNTRFGFYKIESTEGVSEIFQRSFFEQLNSGVNNIGKTLQKSRELHVGEFDLGYTNRWVYLNLVLLGDPETPIKYQFDKPKVSFVEPDYRSVINGSILFSAVVQQGDSFGSTFNNFSLEYGYGLYPESWKTEGVNLINPAGQKNGESVAVLDTTYLKDGPVKFRLKANNLNGQSGEDSTIIFSDNIAINYPFVWSSTGISFNGIATISDFSRFELSYKKINETNLVPITTSTSPVINGPLGTILLSQISTGEYQVNLKVFSNNGQFNEENSSFVFDSDYHSGWPKYAEHYFLSSSVGVGQLSSAPGKELVAGESEYGAEIIKVYGWYSNGSNLPGWPVSFSEVSRGSGYSSSPLIVDADDDGLDEVFISVAGKIYGIYSNGTIMPGWPKYGGGFRVVSLININGKKALVSIPCGNEIYVYYLNGSIVPGWPVTLLEGSSSAWMQNPAVGDFDGDGNEDIIVISSYLRKIFAIHSNGSIFNNWPISVPLCAGSIYPTLADINMDGNIELTFGTGNGFFVGGGADPNYVCNQGYVYAYSSNGNPVSDWPLSPQDYGDLSKEGISTGISLANLDSDPELEMVVVGTSLCAFNITLGFRNYCLVDTGATILNKKGAGKFNDFSFIPNRNLSLYNNGYGTGIRFLPSPAVIGDIDGDGIQEILFSIDEYYYPQMNYFINSTGNKLYAFELNGSFVAGWPKNLPQLASSDSSGRVKFSTPVLTDLDEDGKLDIVFGDERHLIVWNLSVPFSQSPISARTSGFQLSSASSTPGRTDWPTTFGSYSYGSFFSGYIACSTSGECDDSRSCTLDSCMLNHCIYDFSGCAQCSLNSDCNDNTACTIDSCSGERCIYDASACNPEPPPSSGGGGGGSSPRPALCVPNWGCSWSDCINNLETSICTDLNNCGTNQNRPAQEVRNCSIVYGELPDTETNEEVDSSEITKIILIFVLAIVLVVIIFFGFRFYISQKKLSSLNKLKKLRSQGYLDPVIKQIFLEEGMKSRDADRLFKN